MQTRARTHTAIAPHQTNIFLTSNTGNPVNLSLGVNHVVVPNPLSVLIDIDTLGSAKVDITGELPNDHNVDTFDDFSLESGSIQKLGQDLGRPEVGKQVHFLAHLEQTRLGTEFTGIFVPLR